MNASIDNYPDFTFEHHGSICILNAISDAAEAWADERLPADRQRWGRFGTVIEPRYALDILEGLVADGLTVR